MGDKHHALTSYSSFHFWEQTNPITQQATDVAYHVGKQQMGDATRKEISRAFSSLDDFLIRVDC
jgi:hypothetical protein